MINTERPVLAKDFERPEFSRDLTAIGGRLTLTICMIRKIHADGSTVSKNHPTGPLRATLTPFLA